MILVKHCRKCGKSSMEPSYSSLQSRYVNLPAPSYPATINPYPAITMSSGSFPIVTSGTPFQTSGWVSNYWDTIEYCNCAEQFIFKCYLTNAEECCTLGKCEACEFKFKCAFLQMDGLVKVLN